MKLRLTHRTEYLYTQPVRNNSNELRLTPLNNEWQECRFFLLRVMPSVKMRRFTDLNFNWVNQFEIDEPHSRLFIESQGTVLTQNRYAAGEPLGVDGSTLAGAARTEECHTFLQQSCHVVVTPEIWRVAVDVRAEQPDVFETARGIMRHVHAMCAYVPGVTAVDTSSEQFFRDPRGVCQDFAHLMLAMCRAIRIPARYVSGYLYDAKRREVRGAHASHAWVEVFVPGRGWHGLDPTNNSLADDHYIAVAVGRDYDDIAPVKGSFWGGGSRQMNVSVHIEEG